MFIKLTATVAHTDHCVNVNPLMGTKPQSNGPLYSNTVIGTLAVDGWADTSGTASGEPGRAAAPPSPLLAVLDVASTESAQTSYIRCGTIITFAV